MSLATLEAAIVDEARQLLRNTKLRKKDLLEWSTTRIEGRPGEITVHLERNGMWAAFPAACDRRHIPARGYNPPPAGLTDPRDPPPPPPPSKDRS